MKKIEYYYIVMSQISILQNEVIEEILRERANYYALTKKNNDFWLLISPKFIFLNNFLEKIIQSNFYITNKNNIFYKDFKNSQQFPFLGCLITTDKEFLNWIKLRLGYFEEINDIKESINRNFKSNGITGKIEIDENNLMKESILLSNPNFLNPSISIDRYKKSLELYISKQNN